MNWIFIPAYIALRFHDRTIIPSASPSASPSVSPTVKTCQDGRLNGGETDVDCGGECLLETPNTCGPGFDAPCTCAVRSGCRPS